MSKIILTKGKYQLNVLWNTPLHNAALHTHRVGQAVLDCPQSYKQNFQGQNGRVECICGEHRIVERKAACCHVLGDRNRLRSTSWISKDLVFRMLWPWVIFVHQHNAIGGWRPSLHMTDPIAMGTLWQPPTFRVSTSESQHWQKR